MGEEHRATAQAAMANARPANPVGVGVPLASVTIVGPSPVEQRVLQELAKRTREFGVAYDPAARTLGRYAYHPDGVRTFTPMGDGELQLFKERNLGAHASYPPRVKSPEELALEGEMATKRPEIPKEVFDGYRDLMISEEGRRRDVYLDTRGIPTVGIGHRVVPGDHLKLGDVIDTPRIEELFRQDASDALSRATSQAAEAGISDPAFIPRLAAVNLQVGPYWRSKFPKTWAMIMAGKYDDAATALNNTPWEEQTPQRVRAFQRALRALPPASK